MSEFPSEAAISRACHTLFGDQVLITRSFFGTIQPSGTRKAFRAIAKSEHPDLYASAPPEVQTRQAERFRQVLDAYGLLSDFFKLREQGFWFPVDPTPEDTVRRKAHSPGKAAGRYYAGPMPRCSLELGQFLYYSGAISYETLIAAIVWQRRQRPTLGDIARRWGWLSEDDVKKIMAERMARRRFGEKAWDLGYLSVFEVKTLLRFQRQRQEKIGRYFIRNNHLDEASLLSHLAALKDHNRQNRDYC